MNLIRIMLCVLFALAPASAWAQASAGERRVSDPENVVSIEPHPAWSAFPSDRAEAAIHDRPNPFSIVIGPRPERQGIAMLKFSEPAELIPNVYIGVHRYGGLPVDDESLEMIRHEIQQRYPASIGGPFRLFVLERETLAGLTAVRLTGVYRWRTNNIKILQYLIPGAGRLYSVTYTAQEREFNRHLPEVMQSLETLRIADPPVFTGWLGDALKWVVLFGLIGAVLWGVFHASSAKPAGAGSRFSLLGSVRRTLTGDDDSSRNPFMRKK